MQPRYHLEMALLRWIHLRKLTPLADLIQQLQGGVGVAPRPNAAPQSRPAVPAAPQSRPAVPAAPRASLTETVKAVEARRAAAIPQPPVQPPVPPKPAAVNDSAKKGAPARGSGKSTPDGDGPSLAAVEPAQLKEAFLSEVRRSKKFFFGTVVAQAQRIDLEADRFVFVFAPQHRALRVQLEQTRPWLETAASQLAGRKMTVSAAEGAAGAPPPSKSAAPAPDGRPDPEEAASPDRQQALKERALSDAGVQTMLDVFAAEIKDVEEM